MPLMSEPKPSLRSRGERDPIELAELIEGEIIPRLLVAHRADPPRARSSAAITPVDAHAFADLVLREEAYALIGHVEAVLARGATVESVLLDLLAPAARRIGEYWEQDACDFVDVTMGLWRLQEVVHELGSRAPPHSPCAVDERRALFALCPGEQHGFGLLMVEEFFRRAGWATCRLGAASQREIVELVRRRPFELIGLSVNCDHHIERVTGLIEAVRGAAADPAIAVMVGGRAFAQRPDLAMLVGADAAACDAREAVERAEILLEMRGVHASRAC